jgi:uncharacterized protein
MVKEAMMKKRALFSELEKYLAHKNALIITGMRQVGKTTLMKQVFEIVKSPKLWFDFDNPLETMIFENDDYRGIYEQLLKEAGNPHERLTVFIDEIQNHPEISKIIKYHIDHYGVKYIVTGSSAFYLRRLFPESLSGRKFLFILPPLSFQEYLYFLNKKERPQPETDLRQKIHQPLSYLDYKKNENDFDSYQEYGGFPEVVLSADTSTKKLVLKNIFASFFEKDIRLVSDFSDIRELRNLILLLAPRTGNRLDITRLAQELGVSRKKVYDYLELLQGLFLVYLVPRYSQSIDKSVAGGQKVYFSDTGLLQQIGKVNEGQLFENSIANMLRPYGELAFYNKRNSSEIDFIVNKELAFEVKVRANDRDLARLGKLSQSIGLDNYYLVSKTFTNLEKTIFPALL